MTGSDIWRLSRRWFSRLAIVLGVLYPHAATASITAMYVRENPLLSLRSLPGLRCLREENFPIVKDIQQLAEHFKNRGAGRGGEPPGECSSCLYQ